MNSMNFNKNPFIKQTEKATITRPLPTMRKSVTDIKEEMALLKAGHLRQPEIVPVKENPIPPIDYQARMNALKEIHRG